MQDTGIHELEFKPLSSALPSRPLQYSAPRPRLPYRYINHRRCHLITQAYTTAIQQLVLVLAYLIELTILLTGIPLSGSEKRSKLNFLLQ